MSHQFYRFVRTLFYPILHLLFPFSKEGLENLPGEPVVLCANHSHWVDPVLLAYALPKDYSMRIMAKKELFNNPLIGKFLYRLGAFPVDRGNSDIMAVKTAIRTLKEQDNLLIFPEGTRVEDPARAEHKGGAAMIAIRSGVKMLPVYISTGKKPFHRARVIFGNVYVPQYESRKGTAEEYQANADEIMRRVYELGKER